MFCEECGNKMPENAKFCPKCGTPCPQDDDSIEIQNGGTEEHVENVGEPIVENERTSDIENDNSDNFEVPKEPKNHISLTKKAKMIISILEMDLLYSTKALTKKAKMIISAVIAVIIIGAVGITAGIATKENSQTEKKVAKKEKAVKEDKKAEAKSEPKVEEEKSQEPEGLTQIKEVTNMDSITVNELCEKMDEFFTNMAEDALFKKHIIRSRVYTVESYAESYSLASSNIVSDYDEVNFDLSPLYEKAEEGMDRDNNKYRVTVGGVENNFYDEYKYTSGNAEDLSVIVSVNVTSYDEHDSESEKSSQFYALVTMCYDGGTWEICGIREPDDAYYNQNSKYKSNWVLQPRGFERTSLINTSYSNNVAEAVRNASEDNLKSVIEMWKQWYYYIAAKNYESGATENYQLPNISLFYLSPNDKMPSLAVWNYGLDEGTQYLDVYTCKSYDDEIKIIELGRGSWNDQSTALKYAGDGTFMISRKYFDEGYGNVEEYSVFRQDPGSRLEYQDYYIYKSFDAPYVYATENIGNQKKTYFDVAVDAEDIDRIYNQCTSYQGTVPPVYDTVQEAFENL